MWATIVDRLIDLILRRDFEFAGLQGACIAILWGIWLCNPWVDIFSEGWPLVQRIMGVHTAGVLLVLLGIAQFVALVAESYAWRRFLALAAALLWVVFVVLLALDRPYRLAVPSCLMFFVGASWGYLRIGMAERRQRARHNAI